MNSRSKNISVWFLLLEFVFIFFPLSSQATDQYTEAYAGGKNHYDPIRVAVSALENRFIAHGVVLDIDRSSGSIQKFRLKIEKIEGIKGFVNSGAAYQGKEVEILSEIELPSSLKPGRRVSIILRVAGDEWGQSLFLVEVIK